MSFFARLLLFLFILVFLISGIVLWIFTGWRTHRLAELTAGATLVQTPIGVVEVADTGGDGPPVLVLHGAGGGYDQALVLAESLRQSGCRVIAWSRPGYLRTPLVSGIFPEQQADLAAALLETLGVPQAPLLVFAEGTPIGLHALLRHPERFSRAAFLTPLPRRTALPARRSFNLPIEFVAQAINGDLESWWVERKLEFRPRYALYDLLWPASSWTEFSAWQAAGAVVENSAQLEWARRFFQAFTPVHPREVGLRNDVVQMRALPEMPWGEIKAPLLLVRGEMNPLGPPEAIDSLAAAVPTARTIHVPDAGWILPGLGPQNLLLASELANFFDAPRPPINVQEPHREINRELNSEE